MANQLVMKQNCFPNRSGVGSGIEDPAPYAVIMTVERTIHRIFFGVLLATAGTSLTGWTAQRAMAASTVASASAIVLQGASVTAVTKLEIAPTASTTPTIQSVG
jgi:hypothetical protein